MTIQEVKRKLPYGLFICLEGGEGAGKSLQALKLKEYYESQGYEVVLTREPGGIKACEEIRATLLADRPEEEKLDEETKALLFVASRNLHLKQKVLPALAAGKVVIMDRFFYSSLAYQGFLPNGEKGFGEVWELNKRYVKETIPDITLYIRVSNETRKVRLAGRLDEQNYNDRQPDEFHDKVAEGYEHCRIFPEFRPISGEGTPEEVFARCLAEIWRQDEDAASL